MSLAARFPISSSSNNKTCYKNETSIPEVCILDPDDKLMRCESLSSQPVHNKRVIISQESLEQSRENLTWGKERTTLVEAYNRTEEAVVSTPDFIHPFIDHAYGGIRPRPFSLSTSEAKEPATMFKPSKTCGSVSSNLLQRGKVSMFPELHSCGNGSALLHGSLGYGHEQLKDVEFDSLSGSFTSYPIYSYNSPVRVPTVNSSAYRLHNTLHSGVKEFKVLGGEGISSWPSYASGITESICYSTLQQDRLLRQQETLRVRPNAPLNNLPVQKQSSSHPGVFKETNQYSCNSPPHERAKVFQMKSTSITGSMKNAEALTDRKKSTMQEDREASGERTAIAKNKIEFSNKVAEHNAKESNLSLGEAIKKKSSTTLKTQKGKVEGHKNSAFDWDDLRKQVQFHSKRERINDTMDSLDYEAVRCADVNKISESIKERGMNNMLAERIKVSI